VGLIISVFFLNIESCQQDRQIKDQQVQIERQDSVITQLRKELLEKTIAIYEFNALVQASYHSPVPQWSKKVVGDDYIMRWFNPAFVDVFLRPNGIDPKYYLGENDFAVWDSTQAQIFRSRDSLVFATKRPFRGKSFVLDSTGRQRLWNINKYPVFFEDEPIFISGIAYRDSTDQ